MRIALITPWYREATRGNAVTVRRIEHHLRKRGCDLRVLALDQLTSAEVAEEVSDRGFDLCHAFHGVLGGSVARDVRKRSGIPYIVTLTGSDIYETLYDSRRGELLANLHDASSAVAFHEIVAQRVAAEIPSFANRLSVIPQGVDLPEMPAESAATERGEEFVFLLPAGIRPVKNLFEPLAALEILGRRRPEMRLHYAGPVLDQKYAEQLLKAISASGFAGYLGAVNHSEMSNLYRTAEVVLNSSHFEGGMANSLLEGMAWGKPVMVSDREGNRSLVTDGENGLVYRDLNDFRSKAELLLTNPGLCRRLGIAGRRLVEKFHSPDRESEAYLLLYERAVQ